MGDIKAWVGKTHTQSDTITRDKLARFSAVLGTMSEAEGVPAGFHFTLCSPENPMLELGGDGHPQKGGFLPPVDLPRRMWVGSTIAFLAPLTPGDGVERISHIVSIEEKTGKQGRLVFVTVEHDFRQRDALAITERQTLVYREAAGKLPLPLVSNDIEPLDESVHHAVFRPDEVLLFRYSALTFNAHRIHYDRPYAETEEAYPALVVHGPLMASFVLRLAEEQFGVLRGFQFRAEAPAFCGQPLYVDFMPSGAGYGFVLRGGDGRTIMRGAVNTPD